MTRLRHNSLQLLCVRANAWATRIPAVALTVLAEPLSCTSLRINLDKMLRPTHPVSRYPLTSKRPDTYLKYALRYTTCHAPRPTSMPIVPKANHLTLSFVLSFVSLNFCSRSLRYSISSTMVLTFSSMRRSSVSTGRSFSAAWTADQSRASAPMSMSSSTCRVWGPHDATCWLTWIV